MPGREGFVSALVGTLRRYVTRVDLSQGPIQMVRLPNVPNLSDLKAVGYFDERSIHTPAALPGWCSCAVFQRRPTSRVDGQTKHFVDDTPIPRFAPLAIARFDGDSSYYLYSRGREDSIRTQTWTYRARFG